MNTGIMTDRSLKSQRAHVSQWVRLAVAGCLVQLVWLSFVSGVNWVQAQEQKTTRKTCGSCPEGYATTGVTSEPSICKDGDPTLVQCSPLGANLLAVCGSCPEGYLQIGNSSLPSLCGNKDGGLLTQCQLQNLDNTMPDPTQGGIQCPPNCGSTATPGQGAIPPPPKFRPAPEQKEK